MNYKKQQKIIHIEPSNYNNVNCKNFENYINMYCNKYISSNQSNKCKLFYDIFLKKCFKDK